MPKVLRAKQEPSTNGKPHLNGVVKPLTDLDIVCGQLVNLQRQREIVMKSRIMASNRLVAIVAVEDFGYNSNRTKENDRKVLFKKAQKLIKEVMNDTGRSRIATIIRASVAGFKPLKDMEEVYKTEMKSLAKQLPVYKWIQSRDCRGIAFLTLTKVIGETGNLLNYANPAKLWRRMGCFAWTYNGQTHMGQAWRVPKWTDGIKLPAEEWTKYGYSPKRRKLSYLIGKQIVNQNKGPYRQHYDKIKAEAKKIHPDWTDGHRDRHAMLLATKLFLKHLWVEWHKALGVSRNK